MTAPTKTVWNRYSFTIVRREACQCQMSHLFLLIVKKNRFVVGLVGCDEFVKNAGQFVASSNLKPVNFVAGQMAITDGKVTGWAAPQLYILYVNRPNTN